MEAGPDWDTKATPKKPETDFVEFLICLFGFCFLLVKKKTSEDLSHSNCMWYKWDFSNFLINVNQKEKISK